MHGSQALLVTAVCATLTVGVLLTLPAALRLALARHLGRDEASAGGLKWAFLLTLIPCLLLAGLVVDRLGVQEGLILGSLAMAVGLTALALSGGYRPALGALALVGAALAVVHTATAALLPLAFVAPEQAARPTQAMNLGYVLVGFSALLATQLLPLMERKLGVRQTLLVLALVSLVPAAAAGFVPKEDFGGPTTTAAEVLADPRVWLAGLVLFLYHPLERVLMTWAPVYLAEVGRAPQAIRAVLVGFWIAFLGSRFLTALMPADFVPWLLLLLLVLAAATVGNLSGMFHAAGGTLGLWILGVCLGPIFPSLLGLVFSAFPGREALAFGAVVAVGSCSDVALQPLMDRFARGHAVRVTMRLVMLVTLVLAAPALVLCLVI